MEILPTGYWTFFCTPERWDIEGFINSAETKTRYKIQKNQKDYFGRKQYGIISVLNDNRKNISPWFYAKQPLKRGIYAIVEILSDKAILGESYFDNYSYPEEDNGQKSYTVEILFRKELLFSPLYTKNISDDLIENHKWLLKGKQGISASVLQKETFERILEIGNVPKSKLYT